MLAEAALDFDVEVHFFAETSTATCEGLGTQHLGSIHSPDDVARFVAACDLFTFESENTDVSQLKNFAKDHFHPSLQTIEICQDRLKEKTFVQSVQLKTAPFRNITSAQDLLAAAEQLAYQGILKTRTLGYDGKGQWRFNSKQDINEIFKSVDFSAHCGYIVEGFVKFDRELSIIGARSQDGSVAFLPVAENVHSHGMLLHSRPIGDRDPSLQTTCQRIAATLLNQLNYVGTLAVELFDCGGEILINELAPRVHNSGHWSIEGFSQNQFQLHIAALLGMALHKPQSYGMSWMHNVIGNHLNDEKFHNAKNIFVHDYKKTARKNRKLGHVTVVANSDIELNEATQLVTRAVADCGGLPQK